MVTGHEIAGVVRSVGKNVTKFKVGQNVGVGTLVNSCRTCENCKDGEEPYCLGNDKLPGYVATYNSKVSLSKLTLCLKSVARRA